MRTSQPNKRFFGRKEPGTITYGRWGELNGEKVVLQVVGTPATNERFCRAPNGNSYGAALVPKNVTLDRKPYRTSLDNLWMANATAGMPSVAGAMGAGARLYEELAGDAV